MSQSFGRACSPRIKLLNAENYENCEDYEDYEDYKEEDENEDDDNNADSRRASFGLRPLEISLGNDDVAPFNDGTTS